MKKRKLVLALMLSLMMLVTMIPSFSFADETGGAASGAGSGTTSTVMSGSCGATGSDVKWKLEQNNEDGSNPTYTLTVSGTGAMADYTSAPSATTTDAEQGWAQYYDKITRVIVTDGITRIGDAALGGLLNVEEYSFGKDVAEIGNWGIKVNSVKKFVVNGDSAGLKVVDNVLLSKDGTVLYAYPGGADAVESYTTPAGVKEIREMAFAGCDAKKVVFSDGVEKITTGTFGRATTKELVIPDSVTDVGGANQTEKITLLAETINPATYKSFSAMTELNLPNATVFPANFFEGKQTGKLQKVSMPNVTSIGEKGFYYCNALKEVYMPKVETIGNTAFENCTALKNIDFPDTLKEIGNSAFRGAALEKVIFPDSLESIGGAAFANCKNLKTISYGKNINKVGVNAFQNDNAVKVIDASAITTLKDKDYWDASLAYGYIFGSKDVKEANTTFTVSHDFIAYLDKASYAGLLKSKFGTDAYYAVTNGGTFADDTEFTEGTLATPTRTGYKFLGWYDNETITENPVITVAAGGTYYARWEEKQNRTISVNPIKDKVYDTHRIELDQSNCTVKGTGNITFSYEQKVGDDWVKLDEAPFNAGTYRVKATIAEDDTYKSATSDDYVTFNINKADQKLSYNTANIEKHAGDVVFTNLLTETTVDGKLTYASSNEKVATVNEKTGEVTIVGAGEATIKATAAATPNYNEATARYELTVTQHEFSNQWSSDTKGHWHACTVNGCAVKAGAEDHDFEWVVDKEATTTEKGSKHKECTVCGDKEAAVEIPVIENGTTGGDQNSGNAGNSTKADTANGSKTGDTMPIGMLAVLMLAAAAGIAFCGRKLYKSR